MSTKKSVLPWETNSSSETGSASLPWERRKEEGARYANQLQTFPEIFNPATVQENSLSRLSTPTQSPASIGNPAQPVMTGIGRTPFSTPEAQRYNQVLPALPTTSDIANTVRPNQTNTEKNSFASTEKRQQNASNSPISKIGQRLSDLMIKGAEKVSDVLPESAKYDGKAERDLVKKVMDYRSDVQRAQANTAVGAFVGGIGDSATLGLTSYGERMLGNGDVADRFTESSPGKAGQIAGQFLLPAGKIKAGASLLSNVGRGVLAGLGLGAGIETGEYLTGRNDQTLGQRAIDIGLSGALGGAGAGIIDGIGKGLQKTRGVAKDIVGNQLTAANEIMQAGTPKKSGSIFNSINELGEIATGGMSSGIKRGRTNDVIYSPTLSHIVPSTKKPGTSIGTKADQAYIDLVDDIFSLSRFDQAAQKALGRELKPSESVYQLAMASRGSDQITKQVLTNKLVDIEGNVVGDSLKDAMKLINSKDRRSFMDYLLNKHAMTRFERGEKVFDTLPDGSKWTPQKGQEIVDRYLAERPNFAEAEKAFRDFNDNFNDTWLVQTGLLPKNVVDAWKLENPTYIDMQRQFSDLEKMSGGGYKSKDGFGGQKAPSKKYNKYGSTRKVIDPMESMIARYDATIKASKRNTPMQVMYNTIRNNPDEFKGFVSIVNDPPPSLNVKDVNLSDPDGLDQVLSIFDDAYEKALRSSRKDLNNVVPVIVDGAPVYLRFENKQLLDAVLNVNPQVLKGFMAGASKLANIQKGIYTSVNPIFTFTRSIFRDPISAFVNSKTTNNPFTFIKDLATATNDVFRNKELYQEFMNIGGGYTSPNVGTPRLINRTQRTLVPNENKLNGLVQRFGDNLLEKLDKVESVVRVAEYKRARGSGKTLDDKLRGLYESQEVATNFKRRGAKTKELEPLWLYLNASIQSLDKVARAFKDQPGATFGKIALSITGPSLALYAVNRNDPNYQKLRDTEKDRFLHIPMGDGKFFRFPIPPELAPFANIPRRLLDQFIGGNDDAWNDVGKTIVETVIPPGIGGAISGAAEDGVPGAIFGTFRGTPIVGPSVEAFSNQSWTGSPIVPGYLENASPSNQFNDTTSPLSVGAGKLTNTSPMKLDYMLTSIGGDYGKIIQEISSKGRSEGIKSVGKGLLKRLVVDSNESNKLLEQFYDLKDNYDTMYADIKSTGKLPKGYDDDTRKAINQVSDYMSEISKGVREVQASELPRSEKDRIIKELKQMRMEVAQRAYAQFKS